MKTLFEKTTLFINKQASFSSSPLLSNFLAAWSQTKHQPAAVMALLSVGMVPIPRCTTTPWVLRKRCYHRPLGGSSTQWDRNTLQSLDLGVPGTLGRDTRRAGGNGDAPHQRRVPHCAGIYCPRLTEDKTTGLTPPPTVTHLGSGWL